MTVVPAVTTAKPAMTREQLDRVQPREWAEAQVDLFDAVADAELEEALRLAEEGAEDGCSPYGCRSGDADLSPVVSLGMPALR